MLKLPLVVAAALLASLVVAGAALADPPEVSSNWSGYVAVAPLGTAAPTSFSDVTGTWAQPTATCTAGRADSAAFWVGLGGNSPDSQALEQLGTSISCDGNSTTPAYAAWWEIVPAGSVPIPLKIRPGDIVNSAVLVTGQTVTMSLKDLTRRTRFSKTMTLTQPLDVSSAEWIAEAPSDCSTSGRCRAVPLTQFGTVTFTKAAAIGNAHPGTISDPLAAANPVWVPAPIELISDGNTGRFFGTGDPLGPGVGAVPGSLSADGRSFSVSWQPNVSP
jgi:Peptidase A4 family